MTGELDLPDLGDLGGLGLGGVGALGIYWALGPSIKAIGSNLGKWTDYHTANLLKLSAKVKARMGDEPPRDNESVHPRVAKEILNAAAWIDDDLHQEYLAGLIMSSRSPEGKDDGMVFYTRIVESMTASMIRTHHAMYGAYLGTKQEGEPHNFGFAESKHLRALTVSATTNSWALCASNGDPTRGISDLAIATAGLGQAGLIGECGYEAAGGDRSRYQLMPTLHGANLFGKCMFSPPVGAGAIRLPPTELLSARPPHYPVATTATYPPLVDVLIRTAT